MLARGAAPDEHIALIADLLSVPRSERRPLPNLSPQRKKELTLEVLIGRLESLARRRPVVTIFEDGHWIDPTSQELLDLAVNRIRNLPVLLIVTFRPEFRPHWIGQPHVTMLVLDRLDQRDRTALVTQIAGGKALPDDVVAQIVDRTDGVPLFIEELTKSVLESGLLREEEDHYALDGPVPPLAIPTSLHASLMARLDRLGPVRHVAQIGAAFGRWFRYTSARGMRPLRGRAASGPRPAGRIRAGFSEWYATRCDLYLQARAGAGRGLWQPIAHCPAAIARAHRRSAGDPFP
jgi:predicted ATPase